MVTLEPETQIPTSPSPSPGLSYALQGELFTATYHLVAKASKIAATPKEIYKSTLSLEQW